MRRHRSRSVLAVGAGLLLACPLALQAQTPQEIKVYERRLQQLFEQLDRDGNRRLDRQEVQGQPYLERHFDRLDQQQRGYLAPSDLKPSRHQPPPRSERILRKADQNGDGRIDRQEAQGYPWLRKHFDAIDRNGDGSLDRRELNTLSKPSHGQ
ncbi:MULTISPECIES: EF-hand domain-containing protein [unclassified Synechococcus]|uniref:EF-hand domain-containing protein n=1 Tax=unclassified Synechococcus TaxID=2626047 RepID=UPI0020018966|nr:EF-hand domain-containing protein [Synechococcus sp. A10-1-5-1]UPM49579.1 EF-hand domain-containing protein [Synechococcus sp. A10-1-5-1]